MEVQIVIHCNFIQKHYICYFDYFYIYIVFRPIFQNILVEYFVKIKLL